MVSSTSLLQDSTPPPSYQSVIDRDRIFKPGEQKPSRFRVLFSPFLGCFKSTNVEADQAMLSSASPSGSDESPHYDDSGKNVKKIYDSIDSDTLSPFAGPSTVETNYIRVKRDGPIRGVWKINPSLVIPGELLVPLKKPDEPRHNLHLWSTSDTIDAEVILARGSSGKAWLTATSDGEVTLRIHNQHNCSLAVYCRGSAIHLYLPRTFSGVLKSDSTDAIIHVSPAVKACLNTVYEKKHESRHYIGTIGSNGKDALRLRARTRNGDAYGSVFVAFVDEEGEGDQKGIKYVSSNE